MAAGGFQGFGTIPDFAEQMRPLRRNVTIKPMGNTATFLLSDLAAGVTAAIVHADSGSSAVVGGMAPVGGVNIHPAFRSME
ncbi:enoyl-[acyl-carrier-protein] reductase (NADH) [Paraburkholderia sp. GAS333]